MSDEIIKVLDDLGDRFGLAIDWSSENVLPYLKDLMSRYVNYEVITSIMLIVIALLIIIGSIIGIVANKKHVEKVLKEDPYGELDGGDSLLNLFFIVLIICMVVLVICQTIDIVTCYTIPEKIIFEYLNTLVSS